MLDHDLIQQFSSHDEDVNTHACSYYCVGESRRCAVQVRFTTLDQKDKVRYLTLPTSGIHLGIPVVSDRPASFRAKPAYLQVSGNESEKY